jgi:imidazolonepropionase-like amidohydrolase
VNRSIQATLLLATITFILTPYPHAESLAITNVNVIDVSKGEVVSDQTVFVTDGRITEVGPGSATLPAGAKRIAGDGRYLIPGLWDMHVHFRSDPVKPDVSLANENAALLELYLVHGIVGVREMGGDLAQSVLQWREEIEVGKRIGPRILTAGRKIDGEKPQWPGSISVMTPDEGRQAVLLMKQLGADFIKVYFSRAEPSVLRAVIEEAHKQGLIVTGHAPWNIATEELVKMRMDGIEHADCLMVPTRSQFEMFTKEMESRRKVSLWWGFSEHFSRMMWMHDETAAAEIYATMAQTGTWLTPTLTIHSRMFTESGQKDFSSDPRQQFLFPAIWASWDLKTGLRRPLSESNQALGKELFKKFSDNVRAAHKAGVAMLAGTDTGVANNYIFPGWSLHEELENLVKAGFTPLEALQTATINPAKYGNRLTSEGTIEKGKVADLVLLRSNPLQSISRTREIDAVVVRGRYYSSTDLDHLLQGVVEKRAAVGRKERK